MKHSFYSFAILLLVILIAFARSQQIIPDACIEFQSGKCTRCKKETHLYQGLCYRNILGCVSYQNGETCSKCQDINFVLQKGNCTIAVTNTTMTILKFSLAKYSGKQQSNPGDQYGESSFNPSTFEEIKGFQTFQALDVYIRKGEYAHYISRTANPIFSIHYYEKNGVYSYKILYFGSGGGLFLCIADVPASLTVQLRSLTPISASNIIYNCFDYDINGRCIGCRDGNHLENGKCYTNYGGCLKYLQNLCLQCHDYYFLIQNRCVSDCLSVSDSRSILYYESSQSKSTIEKEYSFKISNFYEITIISNKNNVNILNQNNQTGSNFVISNNVIIKNGNIGSTSVKFNQSRILDFNSSSANSQQTASINHQSFYKQIVMPPITLDSTDTLHEMDITSIIRSVPIASGVKIMSSTGNCLTFTSNGKCSKCEEFFFINEKGICQQLSALCVSINPETGVCTKCFSGYVLSQGRCNLKVFN